MLSGPLTVSDLFMTVISRTEISEPAGLSRIGSDIHKSISMELGNYSRFVLLKFFLFSFQYVKQYHLFIMQKEPSLSGSHLFQVIIWQAREK